MKRILLLCAVMVLVTCAAQAGMNSKGGGANAYASGVEVTSMSMGDYGEIAIDSYEMDEKPGQADVEIARNVQVVRVTDTIAVYDGVRFGFRWTLHGTPKGALVQVLYKVTEVTGNVLQAYREKVIGESNTIYYMCQSRQTCPPGDYVVEVIADNGVMVRKVFHLTQ